MIKAPGRMVNDVRGSPWASVLFPARRKDPESLMAAPSMNMLFSNKRAVAGSSWESHMPEANMCFEDG